MRLRVDPERCQGHARCFALVPELFDVDDYGLSSVKGDGTVPATLEDRARLAIANCPEFAIEEIAEETEAGTGEAEAGNDADAPSRQAQGVPGR